MRTLKTHTLGELLQNTVEKFPNRPALSMLDETPLTYKELNSQIQTVKQFLFDQGINKGDKVAIVSENMPNWGVAYFAITSMGAVAVPVLKDFHHNEIIHIIRHSGTKLVFISNHQYYKIVGYELDPNIPFVLIESFTVITPFVGKDKIKEFIFEGNRQFQKYKTKAMKTIGLWKTDVDEDDLAAIIYTSGTTGSSKGVMLSHKNLVSDALITTNYIQKVDENDKMISILPLAHTYECTLGLILPILAGASVYYLDKPPTAAVLLPAMQKVKPTMILTVPLIMEKIFKIKILPSFNKNPLLKVLYNFPPTRKLLHKIAAKKLHKSFGGKLHFFGIGGAKLSFETERFLSEGKFPYAIGYGLTETSPLIAGAGPSVMKFRSTGITLPGIQVRIYNPDPKTGEGEIQVKGEIVMQGYYRDPERTAQTFTEDGWFKTGDLGIFQNKNYLYIKGRLKNVIIGPSGENIYPEEIEGLINQNQFVLESLVSSVEGKIIAKVFLNYEILETELKLDRSSSSIAQKEISHLLENIRQQVNSGLSSFSKITKIVDQKEPFEKTPTMKIKRFLYEN